MNPSPLRSPVWFLSLGAILLLAPSNHFADKRADLSPGDQKFIQEEAYVGRSLVALSGEAASRGASAEVRAFARVLLVDHGRANAQLSKLAAAKEVDPGHHSGDLKISDDRLDSLRKLKGTDFDREFLSLIIEMHTKSVENFEKAATDSPDLDLKKWADGMLPSLKAHLDRATKLGPKTARTDPSNYIVL